MQIKNTPKEIGTVSLQESNNFSTEIPWQPVTKQIVPYSVISEPNGFMFTHGSACASMATISTEGYRYIEDTYVFRKDGTAIDVDRYIGSITPANTIAVLKIPSQEIPFHHLLTTAQVIGSLPTYAQKQILSVLDTQNP